MCYSSMIMNRLKHRFDLNSLTIQYYNQNSRSAKKLTLIRKEMKWMAK